MELAGAELDHVTWCEDDRSHHALTVDECAVGGAVVVDDKRASLVGDASMIARDGGIGGQGDVTGHFATQGNVRPAHRKSLPRVGSLHADQARSPPDHAANGRPAETWT